MMHMTLLAELLVCSTNISVCSSTLCLAFLWFIHFQWSHWMILIHVEPSRLELELYVHIHHVFMTDMLRQMADLPSMEALVQMPIPLSYYIASKLPLQDCTRQELLETEGTVNRLKREIQLLEGMDKLKCNRCRVCMCSAASCLVCDAFVQWFQQAWLVVSVQLICF
jgi:hypothetical protein